MDIRLFLYKDSSFLDSSFIYSPHSAKRTELNFLDKAMELSGEREFCKLFCGGNPYYDINNHLGLARRYIGQLNTEKYLEDYFNSLPIADAEAIRQGAVANCLSLLQTFKHTIKKSRDCYYEIRFC